MQAVLDIESLSTRPDTVILTVGILKFNPYHSHIDVNSGIHLKLDVDEQLEKNRHVSDDTVAWWGTQDEKIREDALGDEGRISVNEAIQQINRYLVGVEEIWVQGPVFDIAALENLYRQYEMPPPWHYWNIRDSRTLFGVHGDPRDKSRKHAHNALVDCYYQGKAIQQVFKDASIVKFKYNSPNLRYANNI